jgi:hypothetical protein
MFAFEYNSIVTLQRKAHGKHFLSLSAEIMGMEQTDILKATQKERAEMTPEYLSLLLRKGVGTAYKAFKKVGKDTWALGTPLSEHDATALIMYYSRLGNEHAKQLAETRRTVTETEKKPAENTVQEVVQTKETEKESTETKKKASRWYYLADMGFFGVTAITAYELYFFLKIWGLFFWAIYALAMVFCLVMAKDSRVRETAQYGYTAVVILECLAFFSHLSMANHLVVTAAKTQQLPFLYNEFIGSMTAPFYIACAISGVLSGIPIFLLWARLNITKELSKSNP